MNTIELEQQLNLQFQLSQQLLTLLTQEKHALVERDPQLIQDLALEKQQLLQQLTEAEQYIKQLLAPTTALPSQFSELTQSIEKNIVQCHQLNQINGEAIAMSVNSLERLQGALIQKRAGNSMTYNKKGKTHGSGLRGGYISV